MGLVESKGSVVLIVEDEFLLRMDAADIIAAAGFEVVEAENADRAIEILEARRDITVVFTDIQMPGSMDGLKLARAVSYRMHTSDSIHSISATKNGSHQSHLLRLRQYLMAQSAYPANPLKKSRFSKYVNRIAAERTTDCRPDMAYGLSSPP
jgi:CheY-like chemotaxis protein